MCWQSVRAACTSAAPFLSCSVPFYMAGGTRSFGTSEKCPGLSDVAPTILDLMGLEMPPQMTGKSLLAK